MPVTQCGQPCFPYGTPKGECRSGTWTCEEGQEPVCEGFVDSTREICNGLDDDCDGRIDNYPWNPIPMSRPCSNSCGTGTEICVDGAFTGCNAQQPRPEVCDGYDNDCDGEVDEELEMPVEFCYTGPAGTVTEGICHPGIWKCISGKKVCDKQQLPTTETCNGYDDDCDKEIDEGAGPNDNIDFVAIFDNSGSMTTVASNLKQATQTWVSKYKAQVERRYALVTAPDNDMATWDFRPHLYQDLTDTETFANAVSQQTGWSGSGSEATIDALDDLTQVSNPLQLSWRSNTKKVVVVFTDEEPQSYRNGCWGYCQPAIDTVVASLTSGGYMVHVFTSKNQPTVIDPWQKIASAGGGQVWDINSNTADLEASLDKVIQLVTCGQ